MQAFRPIPTALKLQPVKKSTGPKRRYKKKPKKFYHEEECRRLLETKFFPGYKFMSDRPSFLTNPKTGWPLELDCYCATLKLALEYNGKQHYEFCKKYHKRKQDFLDQKSRDKLKLQLCEEHGVRLIVVPYTELDLVQYIKQQLEELNIYVPTLS